MGPMEPTGNPFEAGKRWCDVRLVLAAVAVVLLGLAVAVAGKGLPDAEGDGGTADVTTVVGVLAETAFVQVAFAGDAQLEGIAIRGVLLRGDPGAAEPTEWYQFTMANATHAFAAHGTPRDVRVVSSSWNGSVATLEFERSEPSRSSCVFAVVESGVIGDGGFEVLDVAPRGFDSMDAAWPVSACPSEQVPLGDDVSAEAKGSPGLGLGLLAALAVAVAARRG